MPYPTGNHANGIAFASDRPYIPSSMDAILNSIDRDVNFGLSINRRSYLDCIAEEDYSLKHWLDQGILLLNSQLTTEKGNATAHKGKGWERFISFVISKIQSVKNNICYLAWGRDAIDITKPLFDSGSLFNNNFYMSCEHPVVSIYRNRPWHNGNCFLKVNEYLEHNNINKISW